MSGTPGQSLHRDLAPFADPATELRLTAASKTSRLQITRNGEACDYLLTHEDGSLVARHLGNKKFASIRSLLASTDFADVRGLVATQNRIYRDFDLNALLPPEGELNGKRLALQTVSRLMNPGNSKTGEPTLQVLLLDGPAGVGKTSLIQRMLVQRARATQDSSAAPPILHVASRGKRLSSLDDVLAQSLQLIRAKFTFDQLPSLIRHGLVQLAIDGFDELVDPEGYRDAWFALRDFFDVTLFGGPIILAGRDTFFDEQSFSSQMEGSRQKCTWNHARLSEVSTTTAKDWLSQNGWSQTELDDPYTDLVLRPGSYTLRPYFLHELANAKSWTSIESRDLTPRAYLVDRFLDRECQILGQRIPLRMDELKERLTNIFEEVSVEMADTESDAVDLSFLQMVTEIAFANSLESTDVAKLRHKSGSFALLSNDAREGFRRFPHSEISHHFLSRALLRIVAAGEPTRFLRRSVVGADLLAIFAELLFSSAEVIATSFVNSLDRILSNETSFDRLPDNAASLLLTSLSRPIDGRVAAYADLQVPNVVFLGDVATAVLERIRIQRLDASEASILNVEFRDCEVLNLHVDETTRFGRTTPKVHRLHLRTAKGVVREAFDPAEIDAWLSAHSVSAAPKAFENAVAIALLDKVCRVMLRQHMIKDHETDASGRLLRNRYWAKIEEILIAAHLIDRLHGKQMSGTNAPFVRIKDPFRLLANRTTSPYSAIWKMVAAIPDS